MGCVTFPTIGPTKKTSQNRTWENIFALTKHSINITQVRGEFSHGMQYRLFAVAVRPHVQSFQIEFLARSGDQ
eukprot:1631072-Amphidinium_carterae.1